MAYRKEIPMRIFAGSDREIFEDMCIAIKLCTESTEMLFQTDSVLDSDMERYLWDYTPDRKKSCEEIAKEADTFPEDWV